MYGLPMMTDTTSDAARLSHYNRPANGAAAVRFDAGWAQAVEQLRGNPYVSTRSGASATVKGYNAAMWTLGRQSYAGG